jgi:N-acetylneuraminic acid mutarotase
MIMQTRSISVSSVLRVASAILASMPLAMAQWTPGPSLLNARHAPGVVRYGGDIYAVGGFTAGSSLEVLHSGMPSWTSLASLPVPQEAPAAAIVGNRIYTFGGYGPIDTCQIYDIATNSWQAGPVVPVQLYWATAQAVGTDIFLIGGYTPINPGARNSLFILDTTTNTWRQGANLPASMQIPCSAVHGQSIYVFANGGNYMYDLVTGTWSTFPAPPSGHGGGSAAVTAGHFVYLLGGSPGNINIVYTTVEVFDPQTGVWSNGPPLANGRNQGGAVFLPNEGNIYAVGGRNGLNSMNGVEVLAAVPNGFQPYGTGTAGSSQLVPLLAATGVANRGSTFTLGVSNGMGGAWGGILLGSGPASKTSLPMLGGTMLVIASLVSPIALSGQYGLPGIGSVSVPVPVPNNPNLAGFNVNMQAVFLDAGAPAGVAASNGLAIWVR